MQNYYIRIEDMPSLVSHQLSIIKYVVLKKIIFSFSVLTVSFGLGLDLDSNLFGLGLGLVLDSTKVDLTIALVMACPVRRCDTCVPASSVQKRSVCGHILVYKCHKFT